MNAQLDKSNLRQVILQSVKQIEHCYKLENFSPADHQGFDNLVINGMGGSALPAELLLATFFQLSQGRNLLPIYIHRSYGASRRINSQSLVLAISYSGNTEETISAYEDSLALGNTVIALAAGGELIDRARKLGLPYVLIPNPDVMFQPRYATLYIFKAILQVLVEYKLLDSNIIDQIITYLQAIQPQDFEVEGKNLANSIHGKTPIIYASNEYKLVPHLWKIKINENAKTPCFWNYLPELNHNEMVGFTNPQANFQFIFIKNQAENSANIVRMTKLAELFSSRNLPVKQIEVKDYGNYLANLIAMILIGDWTAYYLALSYGIDPTPVDMVEEFKLKMKGQ